MRIVYWISLQLYCIWGCLVWSRAWVLPNIVRDVYLTIPRVLPLKCVKQTFFVELWWRWNNSTGQTELYIVMGWVQLFRVTRYQPRPTRGRNGYSLEVQWWWRYNYLPDTTDLRCDRLDWIIEIGLQWMVFSLGDWITIIIIVPPPSITLMTPMPSHWVRGEDEEIIMKTN